MGVDRNIKTPRVWNWTLSLQHAFTPAYPGIAYVGNHGSKLTGIRDINQETLGSNDDQTTRPFNTKFPYLSNIFQMGNLYRSNYNGLQAP